MPVRQRNRISYIAGRNVKLLEPPREMIWQFLKELNMHLTYDPMLVLWALFTQGNEILCSYHNTISYTDMNVQWNFTLSPKLEMTQMLFKGGLVKQSALHSPMENYTAMKRNQLLTDSRKLCWVGKKKNPKRWHIQLYNIPKWQNYRYGE